MSLQDKLWAAVPRKTNQLSLCCENSGKTGSEQGGLSNRRFKEEKSIMFEKRRRDYSRVHNGNTHAWGRVTNYGFEQLKYACLLLRENFFWCADEQQIFLGNILPDLP